MSNPRHSNGVWHKDGALAQVRLMADWVDRDPYEEPISAETLGKVVVNLRAAADALAEDIEAREQWGTDGWAWLDKALNALGVETVFEIPDAEVSGAS